MTAIRAAIYLRQSLDKDGKELAVSRQRDACRRVARQRKWIVVEEYVDNSLSASKRGVIRPAYERLLTDYRAGRFGAIVVWDLDRLTRQPRQIEDWIEAAEERGLLLTTVNDQADLSTDNGRMFARIKASVARGEVERKSARQIAANNQRAEQGKPHSGRRAFGYSKDGKRIQKHEAAEFRGAVDKLIQGASLRSIVADLRDRGVKTTAGNEWKPTELRRLLVNPRHAGLRVHRGQVVGKGTWKAIIDEDTHRALVAILSDPSRQPKGRPRAYLLSGIARCGACGSSVTSRIYGRIEARGPIYVCETTPHLGRKIEPVDEFVESVMVERLSRPDAASLFAPPDNSGRLAELQAEERTLRAKLDGLAAVFADGDIDAQQLRTGTARLRKRLDGIASELPALVVTPALEPLVTADDVGAVWDGLPVETRRTIINLLADVTVHPPGRGARVFDPLTVEIAWRARR